MLCPELLGPDQFACSLVEALETAEDTGGEQAIADDERRGYGPFPWSWAASLVNVMELDCSQIVAPVSALAARTNSCRGFPYMV